MRRHIIVLAAVIASWHCHIHNQHIARPTWQKRAHCPIGRKWKLLLHKTVIVGSLASTLQLRPQHSTQQHSANAHFVQYTKNASQFFVLFGAVDVAHSRWAICPACAWCSPAAARAEYDRCCVPSIVHSGTMYLQMLRARGTWRDSRWAPWRENESFGDFGKPLHMHWCLRLTWPTIVSHRCTCDFSGMNHMGGEREWIWTARVFCVECGVWMNAQHRFIVSIGWHLVEKFMFFECFTSIFYMPCASKPAWQGISKGSDRNTFTIKSHHTCIFVCVAACVYKMHNEMWVFFSSCARVDVCVCVCVWLPWHAYILPTCSQALVCGFHPAPPEETFFLFFTFSVVGANVRVVRCRCTRPRMTVLNGLGHSSKHIECHRKNMDDVVVITSNEHSNSSNKKEVALMKREGGHCGAVCSALHSGPTNHNNFHQILNDKPFNEKHYLRLHCNKHTLRSSCICFWYIHCVWHAIFVFIFEEEIMDIG